MEELSDWIWCHVPQQGAKIPTRRQLHSAAGHHQWFVFGGFSDDKSLNDLWVLEFNARKWKKLGPKKVIHNGENWPSPRNSQSMILTASNSLIIFGGMTDGNLTNETFEVTISSMKCRRIETTGNVPSKRARHQAVVHDNRMWVFGGFDGSLSNELFCLDLATYEWRKIEHTESIPPRELHSMSVTNNKIFIFGGGGKDGELNDLWSFDIATEKWTSIELSPTPSSRKGHHQAVVFNEWIIVHGGKRGHKLLNEILMIDVDTNKVQTLTFGAVDPPPRYLHSICIWDNSLFVFGGLAVHKLSHDKFQVMADSNLEMFSRKENAISESRAYNGYFASLPTELTHYLLSFFSAKELVKMSRTNKFFRSACNSDSLWKPLVLEYVNYSMDPKRKEKALQNMEAKYRTKIANDTRSLFWKVQYSLFFAKNFSWRVPADSKLLDKAVRAYFDNLQRSAVRYAEFKIGLFGKDGSGKTSVAIQFVQRMFVEEYDPHFDDGWRKHLEYRGNAIFVEMLNTRGLNQEFTAVLDQYIRVISIYLLVYSVTDRSSFEEIETWFQKIERQKDRSPYVAVLVGNKTDLAELREVSSEEGLAMALRWQCSFFETSCKLNINVEEAILQALDDWILDCYQRNPNDKKKKDQCCVM